MTLKSPLAGTPCALLLALTFASNGLDAIYPETQVARFVIDTLDATSFPSSIGPRRAVGKRLFGDYGFTPRRVDEREAVLEEEGGGWQFRIWILRRTDRGIFVCIEDQALNGGTYHTQSVFLLTRQTSSAMLKGQLSDVRFESCPPFAK